MCKNTTLNTVLAAAAHNDLFLERFDVTSAFFSSPIDEEVHAKQPHGFDWCKPGEVLLNEVFSKLN